MSRRIIIAYSNLDIGGIPTKIIDIVNELGVLHPGTEVDILLQKGNPRDQRSLIHNPRAHVHDAPFIIPFGRSIAYMIWLWWRIMTAGESTVLAFISPYALPVLLIKRIFGRPRGVIVSEDHYTETMLHRMAAPRLQRYGVKWLYPHADAVIAPTEAIKKQLIRLSPGVAGRVVVVRNWTRLAKMPMPKDKRIWDLIHIGRLAKSKHPMDVVKIMERHVRTNPNATCVLVGEGSERRAVEAYIQKNRLDKRILVYSPSKNVASFLTKAKAFIFIPEKQTEGFPISLLEAMACGAIVITLPFEGAAETVTDGVTGLVASQRTFPRKIRQTLQNGGALAMRKRARTYIRTHHPLRNLTMYFDLLGLTPRPSVTRQTTTKTRTHKAPAGIIIQDG